MNFKKIIALIISLALIVALCACTKEEISEEEASFRGGSYPESPVLTIYAPETSVLFLETALENLKSEHPSITFSTMYADSVDNAEKIMSGYSCDIFVTDYAYLIDFIDIANPAGVNEYGLDFVISDSRADICTLTPEDAEEDITFSAAILKSTGHETEARLFMQYLTSLESSVFEEYGYRKVN